VNIGVVSHLLCYANVQVNLDAYGDYNDSLMLQQVSMIREKFVGKAGKYEIYESEDNSAIIEIVRDFRWREKKN